MKGGHVFFFYNGMSQDAVVRADHRPGGATALIVFLVGAATPGSRRRKTGFFGSRRKMIMCISAQSDGINGCLCRAPGHVLVCDAH